MASQICFFSSDARELYKSDVFRVLALPKEYVIQFRYQTKYIQDSLTSNLNQLVNKEALIFYVSGNDTTKPKEERELKYSCIRKVKIIDFYKDTKIDTVHFFLEMGDFYNGEIHPDNFPVEFSVSELFVSESPKPEWFNRVVEIKEYFKNPLYFNISSIKHNGSEIKPTYQKETHTSVYSIEDENDYQIEVAFYDDKFGDSSLNAKSDSEKVLFFDKHLVGGRADTKFFELSTKSIFERKVKTNITFIPNEFDLLNVDLNFKINKSNWKQWTFGLFSFIIVVCVFGIKCSVDTTNGFDLTSINYWLLAVCSIGFILSSSFLYKIFNKK